MSYEGYVQVLCRNGHYHAFDCYDCYDSMFFTDQELKDRMEEEARLVSDGFAEGYLWQCPVRGELAGWRNAVDDTNCDEYGKAELAKVSPAKFQTCNLGHQHQIKQATYKPIGDGGHYLNGGLKV